MKEILTAWQWDGPVSEPIPYGEGHINQTYAITVTSEQGAKRYILQKINTDTFKDPAGLMENICGVTDFLREKAKQRGLTRRVPRSMWCLPKREGLITKLPMAAAGVSMTLWRILSACSRCSPPRIFTRAPLHLATSSISLPTIRLIPCMRQSRTSTTRPSASLISSAPWLRTAWAA